MEEGLVWSGQTLLKCLSEAFDGFLILLQINVNQPWREWEVKRARYPTWYGDNVDDAVDPKDCPCLSMFSCPPIPVERTLVQSSTLQPQNETENETDNGNAGHAAISGTRRPGADEFRRDLFRLSPSPDLGCGASIENGWKMAGKYQGQQPCLLRLLICS